MIVGCIGDVHGRACHALALLVTWQSMRGRKFDLVVQVGDLGVLPLPETGERPYDRFEAWDPAVYDLYDLVTARGDDASLAQEMRHQLTSPILVVSGNHDAFSDLLSSADAKPDSTVPIDPHETVAGSVKQ